MTEMIEAWRGDQGEVRARTAWPILRRAACIGLLVAIASARAETARAEADPPSTPRCTFTTTIDGPEEPVVAKEPFEVTLIVDSHCAMEGSPFHVVIAVAVQPGASSLALREVAEGTRRLVRLLETAFPWGIRLGVTIPGRRGGVDCAISDDVARSTACLARLDNIEPLSGGALDEALAHGAKLLRTAKSPFARDLLHETIVIVNVPGETRTPDRDGRAMARECMDARRAAGAATRTGVHVLATRWPAPERGGVHNEDCLRSWDVHYYGTQPWWRIRYQWERSVPRFGARARLLRRNDTFPKRWDLRIPLPDYIHLDTRWFADPGAPRANGVRLSSYRRERVTLVLRSALPGVHPLTEELLLTWEEWDGRSYSQRRPPIGRVTTLAPRRLPTATPQLTGSER